MRRKKDPWHQSVGNMGEWGAGVWEISMKEIDEKEKYFQNWFKKIQQA
jgi:hypothetical protein